MNKFYVGAQSIGRAIQLGGDSGGTFATVEEAIEDAKNKIRSGDRDVAVVVQIIRVCRKEYPPITVETV